MKTYKLKSRDCFLNQSQLKEKDINQIVWILSQSRHTSDISFSGYGHIEYDEEDSHKRMSPTVTEIGNEYKRRNCEVAIFDIHVTGGDNRFNKLFLYKSPGKHFPYYGYWGLNEETGYISNINFIYGADTSDIILRINQLLNAIQRHDPYTYKDFAQSVKQRQKMRDSSECVSDRYTILYPELPTNNAHTKTYVIGGYNKV